MKKLDDAELRKLSDLMRRALARDQLTILVHLGEPPDEKSFDNFKALTDVGVDMVAEIAPTTLEVYGNLIDVGGPRERA